jgi:LPS O-antigen subunit length determinant protein (WzzB/FepE family)
VNEATAYRRGAAPAAAREVSIPVLVQTTRRGVWLLGTVALVCVLITAVGLKLREPVYTATMIVAPAEADASAASQLASELEQMARLATLAQTPPKIERVSALERYLQLFGSTALAARLEAEHHLLRIVFADQWDPERQAWHPPSGVLAWIKHAALQFFGYPEWRPPDLAALAEWLNDQLDSERIGTSALFQIETSHPRRAFAVSLLEMANDAANALLREQAQSQIGGQIEEIEKELATVTDPGRKQALQALLTQEYQLQALLLTEQPYAAQVVVPAAAGATPSSLNPLLALALAAVAGLILGLFVVFLRDALRGEARA